MESALPNIPFMMNKRTVRDEILVILSDKFPLSTKEIFFRVKKQTSREITYQAVHKMLRQMVEEKILEKNQSAYKISSTWTNKIKDYITEVESNYYETPIPKKILRELGKDPIEIRFDSFSKMVLFTMNMLIEYQELQKNKVEIYALMRHAWFPLRFEFHQFDLFTKMDNMNPNNRIVTCKKSPFDLWIHEVYKLTGNDKDKSICGIKEEFNADYMIKGDLIIEVIFSNNSKKELDKIYKKINGFQDLFKHYLIDGKEETAFEIKMRVSINPTLAKLLKEKIKRYFGE